jgi:hypothetical protein
MTAPNHREIKGVTYHIGIMEAKIDELDYELKQLDELKKGGIQENYVDYMIEHATTRKRLFEESVAELKTRKDDL